ncbi:high light inducible protein [Prochlorococcus sp. MIT 1341]|uniref:high light inducible protein n=1 Tax=Prochlorococcus sp. MIT 1341 TaxID=3096221 RepID=UPI002A75F1DE|nr:high light inducible protein [Prochlorococcus sp. MIT 1341]
MTVIKEEGGRYNAFAKEPKIEVVNTSSSLGNGFRLIFVAGAALLIGLIAYTVRIS